MSALATASQVRAIKAAQGRLGLKDPDYRAALRPFGVTSCKDLTIAQANTFLDCLNGAGSPSERSPRNRASGPYADILQALWIAAWNLGVVENGDDAALLAFAKRQAKVDHTRFLRDQKDAARVIEGIKAMLVRGGVVWPTGPLGDDPILRKRAIVAAQLVRLGQAGISVPSGAENLASRFAFCVASGPELDELSKRLGVAVRRALHTPKGAKS